ncbi:MAG TPA: VWA domain-containing protein [Planctomycetota bacterium]
MRCEMLVPELWALLLLLPLVLYFVFKTFAETSRRRQIAMGVLRVLVVALVVTGLVRLRVWRKVAETRLCILALVDVSESMPENTAADVARELAELSKSAGPEKQIGLILFAGRSRVALAPSSNVLAEADLLKTLQQALQAPRGSQEYQALERQETRYEPALELAASTFPPGFGKRILLWSDGNETDGNSLRLASSLGRSGIDLNARVVEAKDRPLDVLMAAVEAPTQVRTAEAYDVKANLLASRAASGKVRLYRNGFLVGAKDVSLAAGATSVVFRQSLKESGQYLYRAVFETQEKQPKDNDEGFAYTTATGPLKVLVIGAYELEAASLVQALRAQKMIVEYRDAFGAPQTLLDLFGYDAVVLNNVPASKLNENQMRMLRDYVRDFGGGLLVAGGNRSLGPGEYSATPLEDALPVTCSAEGMLAPSTAVVLVVDTSRSMVTQHLESGEKFDGVKYMTEAASLIVAQLSPKDFFGMIGTGNERVTPRWLVRLQKVYDKERICADIQRQLTAPDAFSMRSNVYQSMRRAGDELAQQDTRRKSVIVLSDGCFETGFNYPRLAAKMNSDGIQISAIAVGPECDTNAMQELARWGGGLCQTAAESGAASQDASQTVDVVKKVFDSSAASLIIEEPFRARKIADSALVGDIDVSTAPTLFGYVRTKLKLGAANVLAVPPEYDPLLAVWNCGDGKAAVFTSDASDRWAILWLREWGRNFETFWSDVVRSLTRRSQRSRLIPEVRLNGQQLALNVDFLDARGEFISGQSLRGELYYLGEQGYLYSRTTQEKIALAADGPGRYAGGLRLSKKGLYALKVAGPEHGQIVTTGLVLSNFKEYLSLTANSAFLSELASAGGGKSGVDPAQALSLDGKQRETMTDVSHWGILLAAVLFLADVLARRWPALAPLFVRKTAGFGVQGSGFRAGERKL